MKSWKVASSSVAAVLVVGGCSTDGDPQPAALWDPCQIPAESLQAVGVGPEVQASDFLGGAPTGWDICTWRGTEFSLSLLSTDRSFDEVKSNLQISDLWPVVVGTREAVSYVYKDDLEHRYCDVAVGSSVGVLVTRVIVEFDASIHRDPCLEALRSAETLDPALPK